MHHLLKYFFVLMSLVISTSTLAFKVNDLGYRFKTIGINDGLASGNVLQTFQQSNGYMWFATERGASRYDGKNFKHFYYSPGDDFHISYNFITGIAEDLQGNIWLATEVGLNRINPEGHVSIFSDENSHLTGLKSSWIQAIFVDSKGRIWNANAEETQIYHAELNRFESIPIKTMSDPTTENKPAFWSSAFLIKEDTSGNIVISDGSDLMTFDESNKTFQRFSSEQLEKSALVGSYINTIEPLKNGSIAVGTESHGVFMVDLTLGTVKQITEQKKDNHVSAILQLSESTLLIGHYTSGLSLFDMSTGKEQVIEANLFDNMSIASNKIGHLFRDSHNQVWISTDFGISLYSPYIAGSHLYRPLINGDGLAAISLGGQEVYDSFIRENELWVAHDKGLDVIDLKTKLVTKNILKKFNKNTEGAIWQMAPTNNGLWLALEIGLGYYHFTDKTLTLYTNEKNNSNGLTDSDIYTVLPEGEGVWITGYSDVGLKYFDPQKGVVKDFFKNDSRYINGGNYTTKKINSSSNELWMATTEGVYRVNKHTGKYVLYEIGNGVSYMRVADIIEDDGVFWATTQGAGLVKIQPLPNTWEVETTYYTKEHGFPQNELLSLSKAGDLIWLTGTNIVMSFNSKTLKVTTYPSLLNINDLYFSSAASTLIDNHLYLNSNKGVVELDLMTIKQNDQVGGLEFNSITAGSNTLYQGISSKVITEREIPFEDNHIGFSFSALDLVNPKLNQYSYILVGYDEKWSEPATRSWVNYSNLSAGKYIFKVKATNSDGFWSPKELQYSFIILRPWWHFVFILLVLLLISGGISFLISKNRHMHWLHNQVYLDTLTGLSNRHKFNEVYQKLFTQKSTFALLIIDLDYFKDVNDSYGHPIGDQYLIQASKRIQNSIRQSDLLSRLGGDEFTVLITRFNSNADLVLIAKKITDALAQPYSIDDLEIVGSTSIGIAIYPEDGLTSHALFTNGDSALYAAKESGRNKAIFFNESLSKNLKRDLKIRNWFKTAMKNDEFKLYYQPKVNPQTNETGGYEALLRCIHPVEGPISTYDVITVAEKSGDIYEIGTWVIKQVCVQIKKWHDNGKLKGPVSINISAIQLTNDNFVNDVKSILKQTQAPVQFIEFELTETTLLDNAEQTRIVLYEIKQQGITIALDDFGVGYSSLSYLTTFPIDTLKIDRSIIINASLDRTAFFVLKNIYQLASDLSMKVVAEGVETEAQLTMFDSFNPVLIQGYYYSPAVPPKHIDTLCFHNKRDEPAAALI